MSKKKTTVTNKSQRQILEDQAFEAAIYGFADGGWKKQQADSEARIIERLSLLSEEGHGAILVNSLLVGVIPEIYKNLKLKTAIADKYPLLSDHYIMLIVEGLINRGKFGVKEYQDVIKFMSEDLGCEMDRVITQEYVDFVISESAQRNPDASFKKVQVEFAKFFKKYIALQEQGFDQDLKSLAVGHPYKEPLAPYMNLVAVVLSIFQPKVHLKFIDSWRGSKFFFYQNNYALIENAINSKNAEDEVKYKAILGKHFIIDESSSDSMTARVEWFRNKMATILELESKYDFQAEIETVLQTIEMVLFGKDIEQISDWTKPSEIIELAFWKMISLSEITNSTSKLKKLKLIVKCSDYKGFEPIIDLYIKLLDGNIDFATIIETLHDGKAFSAEEIFSPSNKNFGPFESLWQTMQIDLSIGQLVKEGNHAGAMELLSKAKSLPQNLFITKLLLMAITAPDDLNSYIKATESTLEYTTKEGDKRIENFYIWHLAKTLGHSLVGHKDELKYGLLEKLPLGVDVAASSNFLHSMSIKIIACAAGYLRSSDIPAESFRENLVNIVEHFVCHVADGYEITVAGD